ncbi:hypothetical protein PENSPDRAFT_97503 [Peniophora sp. CONT]|nr:hypothetical protein PENSPDRAFT_97503 [Peniophora sp. CONT]
MGQRPSRPTPPPEDAPSTATPSSAPTPRRRITTTSTKRERGSKDKDKRASILGLPTLGSIRKRKPTISRASSATASTSASGSGVRLRDNAGQGNGRSWRRWSRAGRKSVVDVDVEEDRDVDREDVVEEGEEDGEVGRSSTPVVVPAPTEESRAATVEASGSGGNGNVEGSGERSAQEGQQTLGGPLPPAGTLVVVQGVVHTTDVSASLPAPPPPPATTATPTSSNSTPPTSPPTDAGNIPAERERQQQDIPRGVPTLSPTSIDVLGTLLSPRV